MSFYDKLKEYDNFDFEPYLENVTNEDVERVLGKENLTEKDFLTLLSPKAENYLEVMAQKARNLSLKNFGKTVLIYTPMYVANYCENKCIYCGYNVENHIKRKKLTLEEVEEEAKAVYAKGIRHILILTGESRYHSPVSYIKDCVNILKKYFSSISIEVYALEEEEYRELVEAGVDGLTIYQEVYNEEVYKKVHLSGPKRNFRYRLEAPERACRAGMRSLGVGALLGLHDFRKEAFFSALQAYYIQENFPHVELCMSLPRIRPHAGSPIKIHDVNDKNIVQIMLAYKLFLPRAGTNITTRERAEFRDNLIQLGITKISAGVSVEVGGYSNKEKGEAQFDIDDSRSIEEVRNMLKEKGFNPVFKDWQRGLV